MRRSAVRVRVTAPEEDMKILWILSLIVCNEANCPRQVLGTYDTLEQCKAEKFFYEQMPKDNLSFARTIEYKCNLLDSSGNEGRKT